MDDVLVCGAKGVRIFLGFGGNLNGVGCPRRLKPGCDAELDTEQR